MTDSRPDSNPAAKPRGLWSLMGTTEPASPTTETDKPAVETDNSVPPPQPPGEAEPDGPAQPKQRGLWGMMGQAPAVSSPAGELVPTASDAVAGSNNVPANDDAVVSRFHSKGGEARSATEPRRGLFALMQAADENRLIDSDAAVSSTVDTDDVDHVGDIDIEEELHEVDDSAVDESNRTGRQSVEIEIEELEPPKYRVAAAGARRQARSSFAFGLISLIASALSLLPNIFAGVPATVTGFVAIILGYMSITGAGRREISAATRATSLFGMLLGTTGIFLGPLLFASIGRTFREGTGQRGTIQHLTQIGTGLDQHYQEHDGYPIGGSFARNDAGVIQGQHGWMTYLLPYVGEAALYQEIDQSKPFDDPVNRNSMGRSVTVYFAAGGDRSRIGQGFAVAHYAGVGGEIDDSNRLSHLGIFERDVAVKKDEVTDGLSNTLIVGELAGTYPPWGDPENWRKVGRGLNRDVNGFGSYSGNGATFLLADGSVKFFNNRTDLKLLEKMSTRDGSE